MNQEDTEHASVSLREQVDDLATDLILRGRGEDRWAELAETLARIGQQAQTAGYEEAAQIGGALSASLKHPTASAAAEFEEGLARLQQVLAKGAGDVSSETAPEPVHTTASLAADPELVADFILESREHLTSVEQLILTLEREPANADAINSVFRGFHSIKGLAGFLEFASIQEVSHEVETILNLVRDGKLVITTPVTDRILESVDYLSRAIMDIEAGAPCVPLPGHERLLEGVRSLAGGSSEVLETDKPQAAEIKTDLEDPPGSPEAGTEPQTHLDTEGVRPAAATESLSVRVDTGKLDYLVDMVGEMVIAQSLVQHNHTAGGTTDSRLQRDLAQLARITSEVQKTAMAMRMVPIGQLFQRAVRQVRDLSRKVGKTAELATRGEDTELDKTIAEKLADPMMHMVRNAIDHGIEPPEVRKAAGKPAQARITLAAYHQGGQIVIEVSDDGRGLNPETILAKARQQGLADESAHLSESEIFRLILEPGFSTADKVTEISGRGVGMDVVHRQVEKLRGRIEIHSELGQGTTFLLKLPLTLAIIDGLVVTVGHHRYIVPIFAVNEMFRPASESIFTIQNRREMALVRGRLLPVLRLYRRFGVVPRSEDPCQALLIVAESEGQRFCLMVDDLVGKQEVVIKSLGEGLGSVSGIAGGAILGDGRVGLILDMGGLWGSHANS